MNETTLNSLEHYEFCPYQWWLIFVCNEWNENQHTIQGKIVHSKVDKKHLVEKRGSVITIRSLPIFNDEFNLYGIADCVEFRQDESGVYVPQFDNKYRINVIEYKKGKSKESGVVSDYEGLQLYAQMLCVNEMFGTSCGGYIYYNQIHKRVKLQNAERFHQMLIQSIFEMDGYQNSEKAPEKNIGKHCSACSMKDICLPYVGGST